MQNMQPERERERDREKDREINDRDLSLSGMGAQDTKKGQNKDRK